MTVNREMRLQIPGRRAIVLPWRLWEQFLELKEDFADYRARRLA